MLYALILLAAKELLLGKYSAPHKSISLHIPWANTQVQNAPGALDNSKSLGPEPRFCRYIYLSYHYFHYSIFFSLVFTWLKDFFINITFNFTSFFGKNQKVFALQRHQITFFFFKRLEDFLPSSKNSFLTIYMFVKVYAKEKSNYNVMVTKAEIK